MDFKVKNVYSIPYISIKNKNCDFFLASYTFKKFYITYFDCNVSIIDESVVALAYATCQGVSFLSLVPLKNKIKMLTLSFF